MPQPLKVLIAEDDPIDAELLLRELRRAGYEPEWHQVETEEQFLAGLHAGLDLVISDYAMPAFNGFRALALLRASGLEVPFILVSGTIGEETAVAAMKEGAADYLLKDKLTRFGPAVAHALEQTQLRRRQAQLAASLREAEEKYRSIFENAREGIIQSTAEGRILTGNPALARLFGYASVEDLIHASPTMRSHYVDAARRDELMELLRVHGAVQNFETEMRRRDGSGFWMSATVHLRRDDLGGTYLEGTVRDITERKLAEKKNAEQLAELLRWQEVMLDREDRVQALKAEINELLARLQQPPRYAGPTSP